MKKIKFSLLQVQSKGYPIENAKLIKKFLYKTIIFGPDIICLPECSNILTGNKHHLLKQTTLQEDCPVLEECIQFAKKYKKNISIGSLLLRKKNSSKLLNRSFFINHLGKILNHYDKMHLFDVNINKSEIHRESKSFYRGKTLVCVDFPLGKIGLTICYDLRFPNLYQKLAKKGAKLILVPAAFTVPTGRDHWEILLRSRAIENTIFIIATGQCGKHHADRTTYGHSMIINPWGKIIAKAKSKQTIVNAFIDLDDIKRVRSRIPFVDNL